MNNAIMMTIIVTGLIAAAHAQEITVPEGCSPVKGAKLAAHGYADRIIHTASGMEMIFIPAGTFTMGSNNPKAYSTMRPAHQVTIARPFYIGKTEVTNAQYRKFIAQSGYDGKPDTDPEYDLYLRHFEGPGKSLMSAEDNYPVVWVSWKNAKAFCAWAGMALPTEAQWEYACRAGTNSAYYFGEDDSEFPKYGWAIKNSDYLTHPVAEKLPNAWGLYDMLGNVWEWVEDDYRYGYKDAPTDGSAFTQGRLTRILRGGCWGSGTAIFASGSGARFQNAPTNASSEYGFRAVLGVSE